MEFGSIIRSRVRKVLVLGAEVSKNPFGPFDQILYSPDLLGGLTFTRSSTARYTNDASNVKLAFYAPEETVESFTRSSTARYVTEGPEL